jgi:hypothetical protein
MAHPWPIARPLDLLGQSVVEDVSGLKILDFGYGTIGHLHLLAGLGAEVTGVDVDPMLRALYGAPGDQGPVKNRPGRIGSIRLIHGHLRVDPAVHLAVGGDYDLIISKNTLKRGYVHPEPMPASTGKQVILQLASSVPFADETARAAPPLGALQWSAST